MSDLVGKPEDRFSRDAARPADVNTLLIPNQSFIQYGKQNGVSRHTGPT